MPYLGRVGIIFGKILFIPQRHGHLSRRKHPSTRRTHNPVAINFRMIFVWHRCQSKKKDGILKSIAEEIPTISTALVLVSTQIYIFALGLISIFHLFFEISHSLSHTLLNISLSVRLSRILVLHVLKNKNIGRGRLITIL